MGDTLATLRQLFIDQSDFESDDIDASSDPSTTLINTYINKGIRKIVRRDRPRELMLASEVDVSVTDGDKSVTIPATIFVPDMVYHKNGGGKYIALVQQRLRQMIDKVSSSSYFNSDNKKDPAYYSVRGTSIVFDTNLPRTDAAGIKIFGLAPPTVLSLDADTTELPIDYSLQIIYESLAFYYQKDEDIERQKNFETLAAIERAEIKQSLDTNEQEVVEMDPYTFTGHITNIGNPNVFFSS